MRAARVHGIGGVEENENRDESDEPLQNICRRVDNIGGCACLRNAQSVGYVPSCKWKARRGEWWSVFLILRASRWGGTAVVADTHRHTLVKGRKECKERNHCAQAQHQKHGPWLRSQESSSPRKQKKNESNKHSGAGEIRRPARGKNTKENTSELKYS